jgi:hypothetical protein
MAWKVMYVTSNCSLMNCYWLIGWHGQPKIGYGSELFVIKVKKSYMIGYI